MNDPVLQGSHVHGPRKPHVKQRKPNSKRYILYHFIYVKFGGENLNCGV